MPQANRDVVVLLAKSPEYLRCISPYYTGGFQSDPSPYEDQISDFFFFFEISRLNFCTVVLSTRGICTLRVSSTSPSNFCSLAYIFGELCSQKTKLLKLYREVRKATTALSDKGPTGGDRAKSPWGNAKWGNQGLSSNEGGQSVGKAGGSLDPTHI